MDRVFGLRMVDSRAAQGVAKARAGLLKVYTDFSKWIFEFGQRFFLFFGTNFGFSTEIPSNRNFNNAKGASG